MRIARAGGQKVTIHSAKRAFFRRCSDARETFFVAAVTTPASPLTGRKYRQFNAVAAKLALEGGTKLFRQPRDNPLELHFFAVALFIGVQNLAVEREAGGQLARTAKRDFHLVLGRVQHRKLDNFRHEEGDRNSDVLCGVGAFQVEIDAHGARGLWCGGAELRRKFREERAQGDSAILFHLRKMVAVNDGKRPNAAADRSVGGARGRGLGRAAVDVDERGDDLEVVLHPVVDLADQLPLPFQGPGHVAFRIFHPPDRASEGLAEFPNLGRRPELSRQYEFALAGLVLDDRALEMAERTDQLGEYAIGISVFDRRPDFERAMQSLFAKGEIRIEDYGKPSKRMQRIVRDSPLPF